MYRLDTVTEHFFSVQETYMAVLKNTQVMSPELKGKLVFVEGYVVLYIYTKIN